MQRIEVAVDAVGVAALVAHFLRQARHETAAAQHVVADDQREEVRIVALDGRQADVDVAWVAGWSILTVLPGVDRGQRRQGGGRALRQPCGDAFGDLLGLAAGEVADQRDARIGRRVVARVEIGEIVAGEAGDRLGCRLQAVGMFAVHGGQEGLAGDGLGRVSLP